MHVLAMQWEFPDSKNYTTNFEYMCMVFKKYGWNVHKKAIPWFTGFRCTQAEVLERKLQAGLGIVPGSSKPL